MRSHENDFVETLSRGMKQRVCLARVLIHEPKLLLMDEPVAGMDPVTRSVVKEMLKRLKEEGMTVIISSHVLTEMTDLCTHIGIMDGGKCWYRGNRQRYSGGLICPIRSTLLFWRDRIKPLHY